MPIAYIVAITAISIVSVVLGGMVIVGFIQGIREHREHPEDLSYGEYFTDQMDTGYTDVWGTYTMYSKTDSTGKTTYYDPFGTRLVKVKGDFDINENTM